TSPADRSSICMVEDYKRRRTRHVVWSRVVVGGDPRACERLAAGARELPLLEALLAEDRSALRRSERHRRILSARRAGGLGLAAIAHRRTRAHPVCPFCLARLAALRLVLELLVGEEELLTGCPDELRRAVHTPQGLVLE